MHVIIGLGNPGMSHKKSRHNVGFMAVDAYADREKLKWKNNKRMQAEISSHHDDLLVKPLTFMNKSGIAAQAVLSYYKLLPTKKDADLSEVLTVIHDDLDLEIGRYKRSWGSGSAGHNGVQSIIDHLQTKKFHRLRIGISPAEKQNISSGAKFVLQKFNKQQQQQVTSVIDTILDQEFDT